MQENLMKIPLEELQEMLLNSQRETITKVDTKRLRKGSNVKETFYSLLSGVNSGTNLRVNT